MSRVVIVSNRVTDPNEAAQAGGVAVAISDCLRSRDGLWFGWSGGMEPGGNQQVTIKSDQETTRALMPLSQTEYNDYYLGYSNSVLWPVFHNRVDLAQFEAGYFDVYCSVNRRFAKALQNLIKPDDLIWIHDYHFILLALELRALGVMNKIGFFLHIPFPPAQSFLAIPEHREIAHAFAAFDLIGLQATTDTANFIDSLKHGANGQLLPDGRMRVGGSECVVGCFPVGIDADFFKPTAVENPKSAPIDVTRICGVDRLDYTKGLPQKFRAFGRFLEQHTEYRGKAVLTQIATPTRESLEAYADIRKELESLAGQINGAYGDLEWVPIHYINRGISRQLLVNVYRGASVGLVTPLRDGMNLVAKEYIASQDPENPGVLVLSQFAGAVEQMGGALQVNPYNINEISDAIQIALEMPKQERQARHAFLLENIETTGAKQWADQFLEALVNVVTVSAANRWTLRRALCSQSKSTLEYRKFLAAYRISDHSEKIPAGSPSTNS
jgi:trehalose 6-phosphate synthase